ncbi:hypothetical protein BXT86_06270 [candidate division WOR-3 bacterium 4484_100]|uniref:Polymerase nucleotidyl transferase domain-containing protein n=1 Tax=candidate division WOR-3 bacterium 4484_100 TaxID=1936077 RepID=A0A1V4QFH7_UNCW3|nr:MAG: hypothetical protein BXT86_06270 [candidate division WOR-3 bacterium 4484_100]
MSRSRFLNRKKVIAEIKHIAQRLKRRNKDIKKIVLFGSIATGDFTLYSDADILIVLTKSNKRFIDRIPSFLIAFLDADIGVDVFPYTEEEVLNIPLAKDALSKGLVLA